MPDIVDRIFAPAPGFGPPGNGPDGAVSARDRGRFDLNDRGNAARLAAVIGRDLVWCPEWGWGVWTGIRYDFDAGEVRAFEKCAALQDIVEAEAVAARDAPVAEIAIERELRAEAGRTPGKRRGSADNASAERNIRRARYDWLHEHAEKCGNVPLIERAMKMLRPRVRVRLADLDSRPRLLTVANGVVDLDRVAAERPEGETDEEAAARMAGWLIPNERQGRPTRAAAATFDPAATCPRFEAFVDLIQPKPQLRAYLQRCCGLMISGVNDLQVALLFQGEGANGKSTLMRVLARVLGSYAAACRIEMFLAGDQRSSSAATPDEAELPGARIYTASEPEPDAALSDAKVKAFTGGDERKSRANFGDPFGWFPGGVPVLSFNRMPSIKGDSFGTRRRLAMVPFAVNLRDLPPGRQRAQADVEAEMVAEYPGILNWLLAGYAEARALSGLMPPAEADTLKEALLSDADPVGEFIRACLVPSASGRVRTSEFYKTFAAWAADAGARIWRDSTIKKVMVQKGYRDGKVQGYPHFHGLDWQLEPAVAEYRARGAGHSTASMPGASMSGDWD